MNLDSMLSWPPTSPNSSSLVSPFELDHHETFEHTHTHTNINTCMQQRDTHQHHQHHHDDHGEPFTYDIQLPPLMQHQHQHQSIPFPSHQHQHQPSQYPSHDQVTGYHEIQPDTNTNTNTSPSHHVSPNPSVSSTHSTSTSQSDVSTRSMSTSSHATTPTSTAPSSSSSRPIIEHVIHVPPPPSQLPQLKNIPKTDPAIDQAFSEKVAAKKVKRPRLATKLMVGEKVVPVSRRTKYAKLLETMNAQLAAVRQQLLQAQHQLSQYEPIDSSTISTSTSTSTTTEPDPDCTSKKRRISDTNTSTPTSPSTSPPSSPSPETPPPSTPSSTSPLSFDQLLPQTRAFLQQSVASQSLLMGTYVHSPLLFLKMDLRRRILDANVAFCETHGWDRSELIGRLLPPGHPSVKNQPGIKTFLSRLVQTKIQNLKFYEVDAVAPLKNGLPVGMSAFDMLPLPDALQAFSDMHSKRLPYVTYTQRQVNARGQLTEFRGTAWVVYEDGPSYPTASSSSSLTSSSSTPFPQVAQPPIEPLPLPMNPQAAEALDSLRSLYSTLHEPDSSSSVLFKQLKQHINPHVLKCLHHPTLDVAEAMQQAFGGPKPLYVMTVVAPSDQIILRHPPESHPYEALDDATRDQQWNDVLSETAGVLPFVF